MISYSEMILLAQDGEPHTFKFVAKGDDKRKGGYIATLKNAVVTSSFHYGSSFNIKSLNSNQIRKIYSILITEFDEQKVRY